MQSGSVAVGVDLGGTNLKVALVDAAGDILANTSLPTGAERGPESVVRDAAEAIETLLKLGSI